MGCGSSTAAGGVAPNAKDPEDFHLDPIKFEDMGIPVFDKFLGKIAKPVNTVIDITNTLNSTVDDIKEAVAAVCGAYAVDAAYGKTVKDSDRVLMTLVKAVDGTYPTPDEVKAVVAGAKKADTKLAKALAALSKSNPTGLSVAADVLAPASPKVTAFNTALTELRKAVSGAGLKVTLAVKPAGVPGGAGVRVALIKPVFTDPKVPGYYKAPLSVLEIAQTTQAKAINAAESAVAEALAGVAKALKDMPAGSFKLAIKRRKLTPTFPKAAGAAGKAAGKPKAASAAPKIPKPPKMPKAPKPPKEEGEEDEPEEEPEAEEEPEEEEEEDEEEEEEEEEPAEEKESGEAVGEGEEEEEPEEKEEEEPAEDAEAAEPAEDAEAAEPAEPAEPAEEKEEGEGEGKASGSSPAAKAGAAASSAAAKAATPSKAAGESAAANPAAEAQAALRKATAAANVQIFKLQKACNTVNGPVSLAKGLIAVLNAIKKQVMAAAPGGTSSLSSLVKFKPKVSFSDKGELDFDFDININLPSFEGKGLKDIVKMLPGEAQLVWTQIQAMKDSMAAMFPKFSKLSKQVMDLVKSADKVFSDPTKTIKEAMGDKVDMMKMMQMGTSATKNVMKIKDMVNVIQVFIKSLKRIADELSNAIKDMEQVFNPAPAAAA